MRTVLLVALLVVPAVLAGCTESKTGVEGRVLDRDTKAPVAGAEVKATSGTQEFRTTTDGEGHYFLELPPGPRKLRASAEGYEDSEYSDVVVEEGKVTTRDLFVHTEASEEAAEDEGNRK